MEYKVSSGSAVIDELLEGGFESDVITTVYGSAGTGKTTLCVMSTIKCALDGKKVIFVDTEGGFSIERLKQLTPEYEKVLDNKLN